MAFSALVNSGQKVLYKSIIIIITKIIIISIIIRIIMIIIIKYRGVWERALPVNELKDMHKNSF